jgi:citrate lyase beta subunit
MIELIHITNDPAMAQSCDTLGGFRLFVDLEYLGKAERQAGRDTHLSSHQPSDVGRVRAVLTCSRLMVRLNPWHDGSAIEIEHALAQGADLLMLPMFERAQELRMFCKAVDGRAGVVALLETVGALDTLNLWVDTPGLQEIYVGLNDLHLSAGLRFMFEPLALGWLDRVALAAHARGLRFGFGGIARMNDGLLTGRDVLAEHLRLGSGSVILSRTFHRQQDMAAFAQSVNELRATERVLQTRSPAEVEADRQQAAQTIRHIAAQMDARASGQAAKQVLGP